MTEPGRDLQFDRAEFDGGSAAAVTGCAACQQPLADTYYEVSGATVCERCRHALEAHWNQGSGLGRLARATTFGIGAALGGSLIYFAVGALLNLELSLIAILVGYMVGAAVRKGARQRGGWLYQGLAMFLTYTSIVSSYMLLAIKNEGLWTTLAEPSRGPFEIAIMAVVMFGFMYAVPFMQGIQNILGLIIIGIGLYQAWSMNKKQSLVISGPYHLATRPVATAPTSA